jgi:hypothetical protein
MTQQYWMDLCNLRAGIVHAAAALLATPFDPSVRGELQAYLVAERAARKAFETSHARDLAGIEGE